MLIHVFVKDFYQCNSIKKTKQNKETKQKHEIQNSCKSDLLALKLTFTKRMGNLQRSFSTFCGLISQTPALQGEVNMQVLLVLNIVGKKKPVIVLKSKLGNIDK